MAFPVADPFRTAIRNGVTLTYTVDATVGGVAVPGASGLAPTGGSITDTTKPGVRRVLNLELAPTPGLFDLLAPVGIQLAVTAHVRYTDRTVVNVPMGVFDIDSQSVNAGGGAVTLTAPDKWARIQRARFVVPQASSYGALVVDQIATLIRGALGASEPVVITATSRAAMGSQVWAQDRDKAILELAAGIGAWVFFDRYGVATVADIPTIGASADWLVDASATGVLTELSRQRSRADTYNVIVVSSSATDQTAFPTQRMWDTDVNSTTYAGPDPFAHPELAGPFGVATNYFDTPLPLSVAGAQNTARTMLAAQSGLASSVSLGQVPNPAADAYDVLEVVAPRERRDMVQVVERHVADTITHPLTLGAAQTIDGRSTRTAAMA